LRTDAGWEVRHALVRDALLAKVPQAQLRRLHRRAADALQALDRPATRIGFHLVQAGDRVGAVPWVIEAARSSAALGAYREGLEALAMVREAATGADLAALLSLRADLLMAEADPGTVDAYREALACVSDPTERSKLRARLARAATFSGDLDTAAVALDGLTPDGSPDDATLLMARGCLAFYQGDLDAAAEAAAEARRRVILGVPQEWQMFDLVSLQGLVAHTRGQWFERLDFEMRRGVSRPGMAARIFDSHLCVAEYLLYGPTPYPEIVSMATELRDTAERAGVLRAVAFATTLRGEAAYLMGDLELAAGELRESSDLHHDIGSTAGEAHSLQRLAEVQLALGDRAEANRLLIRALPLARFSSIALHIIVRVYGTLIEAAADAESARAAVDRAEATMGVDDHCMFCSIMFAVPAAKACADAGDLREARQYLQTAEKSAQLWKGTSWQASLMETKGRIALAEHDLDAAAGFWAYAADLFDSARQPRDARRCREQDADTRRVPSLSRRRADAS
jgi:tetratricopeptide (TPR) repeat protein